MLNGRVCNRSDFDQAWFRRWRPLMRSQWANGVQLGGEFLHRKEWEFVTVCQALDERGVLAPGKSGVGFAVGKEPLPSLFADRGCRVLATDYFNDAGGGWKGQWAEDKSAVVRTELCSRDCAQESIDFRRVDMNAIPDDIAGHDFSWSCCALEHLGSLAHGFRFLLKQMNCLRPGGWAVHTTEYNLSSNDDTITNGKAVVYRRRDVDRIARHFEKLNHRFETVEFSEGSAPEDLFIARRPWNDRSLNLAHLRLPIGPFVCTSLMMIIRKGA